MHDHGLTPPHGSWLHWVPLPDYMGDPVAISWLVIILLGVLCYLGTRRLKLVPSGLQNLLEWVVEGLDSLTKSIIGPQGGKFTPLIASLFIYILVMNVFGLIPGFISPTSTLNMTVALALVVFVATHFYGARAQGFLKYLKHLAGEPIWLAPLMFPVHVIGELARPLSLSVRLFGNIFGKEMIIFFLAMLVAAVGPIFMRILTQFAMMPLNIFIMGLGILVGLVQALVFSLLAAVYISLALEAEAQEG